MTTVPVDILEHVVDILAADDDQISIKAFSLVCHSVLHFCRKHIFKTIIIDTNYPEDKQSASVLLLCRLICNAPHIADYVRVLIMDIYTDSERLCSKYPDFAYILGKFNHIQSLTIFNTKHSRGYLRLYWYGIEEPLQRAILHLVQLDTLTALHLGFMRLPITKMELSANLQRLELDDVGPLTLRAEDNATSSNAKSVHLREFRMDSRSSTIANVIFSARRLDGLRAFNFDSLRHFHALWYGHDGIDATRNVLAKATHLATFDLTGDVAILTRDQCIDIK